MMLLRCNGVLNYCFGIFRLCLNAGSPARVPIRLSLKAPYGASPLCTGGDILSKKQRNISLIVFGVLALIILIGIILIPGQEKEPIQQAMKDGVLHDRNRVGLFGLNVNPGLISAFTVTGIITVFAVIVRIFVIPKFTEVPGKFQLVLETAVKYFSGLAKNNSPHRNGFLGAYVFAAGVYVAVSTVFELLGLQAVTTEGASVTLPAPLADINGAIAMGFMSYGVILVSGIIYGKAHGAINALKDFSLPISMSFRLFGALLSGALVTDLVYHYTALSFVLPAVVAVLFTLLHAIIQTYVLTMLVSVFYGESTEERHKEKKPKKKKSKAKSETNA